MASNELSRFEEAMESDEALRTRFQQAKSRAEAAEVAAAAGYALTEEQLISWASRDGELGEDDLKSISAGFIGKLLKKCKQVVGGALKSPR